MSSTFINGHNVTWTATAVSTDCSRCGLSGPLGRRVDNAWACKCCGQCFKLDGVHLDPIEDKPDHACTRLASKGLGDSECIDCGKPHHTDDNGMNVPDQPTPYREPSPLPAPTQEHVCALRRELDESGKLVISMEGLADAFRDTVDRLEKENVILRDSCEARRIHIDRLESRPMSRRGQEGLEARAERAESSLKNLEAEFDSMKITLKETGGPSEVLKLRDETIRRLKSEVDQLSDAYKPLLQACVRNDKLSLINPEHAVAIDKGKVAFELSMIFSACCLVQSIIGSAWRMFAN